ncbi:MAG: GAF and ANTAR domain-containing protein [Jatrophihabitantaceae bacterium]
MERTAQVQLSHAFVSLADSLVHDFDVVDLLDRLARICVDVLGVDEAGLLLTDQRGNLRVMAASSEAMHLLELYQLQNEEGPCLDSYRTGQPVVMTALDSAVQRWPRFGPAAIAAGFVSVQALPMRLRDQTIGGLNLFSRSHRGLSGDLPTAQALADVATIAILHHRAAAHSDALAEQLQTALSSRLVIEQAKGKLAERGSIDVDDAFNRIRDYCRAQRLPLTDTARQVVNDEIDTDAILHHI